MKPQPKQFSTQYSSIFQDASVVAAYHQRAPYPPATFTRLAELLDQTVSPRRVLDAGCGMGQIASGLLPLADHIDAVDVSAAMIAAGQQMPYGADPRIQWILGSIEAVELEPPYALIVAAASLHWMPWDVTLPRCARLLSSAGYLAIVDKKAQPNSWDAEIKPLFAEYSMNQDFQPYSMRTIAEELTARDLFKQIGIKEAQPHRVQQSVDEWIYAIHSSNGFSRDRMDKAKATAFDQKLRGVMNRHCPSGVVEQTIGAEIIFGKPLMGG